jgi:hypothetical protein
VEIVLGIVLLVLSLIAWALQIWFPYFLFSRDNFEGTWIWIALLLGYVAVPILIAGLSLKLRSNLAWVGQVILAAFLVNLLYQFVAPN